MLQKKIYITPTTRFASVINIYDYNYYKTAFLKKKFIQATKKIFYNHRNILVTHNLLLNFASVVHNYLYNKKPYQLFLQVKSIFNQNLIMPGVEFINPGRKIYNLTSNILFKKIFYLGSQIFLKDLPYHLLVSFLTNNNNNKWTFIKSSGTYGTKLKGKKSIKLILVKLPSTKVYLFKKCTKCFIGKNYNFFNNKFIEGKWGFSLHKTKQLSVRGVAMNPVDHPNGGRTKSKQPEKSPWGWIAKNRK